MSRSLILDPRSERAANVPLEIYTEPGMGPGVHATAHSYPDPEQTPQSAGGREGQKRSGPPVLGNRQIPLELLVLGRRTSYPFDRINWAINPKGELAPKWQGGGGGIGKPWTVTRELASGAIPSYLGEYRDKHSYNPAEGGGNGLGFLPFTFPVAGTWTISQRVWIPSSWDGGAIIIQTAGDYAGSTTTTLEQADLSKRDQWQRISTKLVVVAGDLAGNLYTAATATPTSAATGVAYTDALLIENANEIRDYFDGEIPGSFWQGVAHASVSQQPGNSDDHFERIVADLERTLAKIRDEGGTLSRPYRTGRGVFDLEGLAGGAEGGYDGRRWLQQGHKYSAVLEGRPHMRAPSETRTAQSQTADPVLVYTESAIPGAVRALGQLEIADAAAIARRGFVAAVETPDYDSTAATAGLYYQAEALTNLGTATKVVRAGAVGAGSNVIQLRGTSVWTSMASTKIAASGLHLTHSGTFRLWARVFLRSGVIGEEVSTRLDFGQGDLVDRELLDKATVRYGGEGFYLVDLGTVRVRKAKNGPQQWEAVLQIKTEEPQGCFVEFDDLRICPLKDAYVRVSAPRANLAGAPSTFVNVDRFESAGLLNGKTPTLGTGPWASTTPAADPDFSEVTAEGRQLLERAGTGKRIAVLPTSIAGAVVARANLSAVGVPNSYWGLIARFTSEAQMVALLLSTSPIFTNKVVELWKWVGGVKTKLRKSIVTSTSVPAGDYGLFISASGFWMVYYVAEGSPLVVPVAEGYDADLATGGVLANGKAGVYDENFGGANNGVRRWDTFQAYQPNDPVLIPSGRRLRWRHDGVLREQASAAGTFSEVGYEGDPLYLPQATREGRPMRVIAFPSRGDLEAQVPDSGASDDFTSTLTYVPRYLSVRG